MPGGQAREERVVPSQMISILVTGGRDYGNRASLERTLDAVHQKYNVGMVIQGGATGVDALAKEWAIDRRIQYAEVPAYWHVGFSAGPIRNSAMLLLKPDLVISFPGGKGTKDMSLKAASAGIRVEYWT